MEKSASGGSNGGAGGGGPSGEGLHPQVFVVDSQAPVSFLPKILPQKEGIKRFYLFYLLLGLALLGVVIEGAFIYRLYHPKSQEQASHHSPQTEKQEGDNLNMRAPLVDERTDDRKPLALLQGSTSRQTQEGVILWLNTITLKGMEYNEGKLLTLKDGFYYIYSKVYFSEICSLFRHQVIRKTPRYSEPMELMQGVRFICADSGEDKQNSENLNSSFLGGVFYLYSGDEVYVLVKNASLIRAGVSDNFFGAFMI